MNEKQKILQSFIISAILTVLFIVIVTITAELTPSFKGLLKAAFGHHWVAKGFLTLALFGAAGLLLARFSPSRADLPKIVSSLWLLSVTALIGSLVLFTFFIYEAFHG